LSYRNEFSAVGALSMHKVTRIKLQVGLACCFIGFAVNAADVHFQPVVEARVESNTNRNLAENEADESDSTGYIADMALVVTSTTARHQTIVRPRVKVQEYPDTSEIENVEGFLDLSSKVLWQRASLDIAANYSHEDLYNAELANARFDDVTPDDPTSPESGNLQAGRTRDWFRITPYYEYEATERAALGFGVLYETASYDGGSESVTDYDYGQAEALFRWKFTPETEFSIGPYVSRYEARDDSSKYDAYGVTASVAKNWSEKWSSEFSVGYEKNEIEYADPALEDEEPSGWSALLTLDYKGEVSRLRFVGGQRITPSSDGRKTASDELRMQYDRDMSARLSLQAAARYVSDDDLGDAPDPNQRDYARADLGLRYKFTQTWYMTGGYRYVWQERSSADGDADNHSFIVGIGYSGLSQPRID